MPDIKCEHRDEWGFCKKYSNDAVVWKCKEDADCEGYAARWFEGVCRG